MNLALPAALLLILALPGFIFVYAYKGRLRSSDESLVSSESMTVGGIIGLLIAIAAHAVWVPLTNWCQWRLGLGTTVDIDSIAYLLAGEYKEGFSEHAQSVTQYPYATFSYFASLYLVALGLGAGAHSLVTGFGLDRKYSFFRFNNDWHYLFFPTPDTAAIVTVSCSHQDYTCLYTGVLETYEFNSGGELVRITLLGASRAKLDPSTPPAPVFTRIPGARLMIWYRDINTLNIEYKSIAQLRAILAQST